MSSDFQKVRPLALIILIVGLIASLYVGALAGAGDISGLLGLGILLGGVLYVTTFYRYFWYVLVVLFSTSFFSYRPFGFEFNNQHLLIVLVALLFVATFWRKSPYFVKGFNKILGYGALQAALWLWLLYGIGHFVFNYLDPYSRTDYSLATNVKTSFEWFIFPFLAIYFFRTPYLIRVPRGFVFLLGTLMLVGLTIYTAIVALHPTKAMNDIDEETQLGALMIPIINATFNVYWLRIFGPLSVLFGTIFLTLKIEMRGKQFLFHGICLGLIIIGTIGSAMSGGRAALLVSGIYIILSLTLLKKFRTLAGFGAAGVFFILCLNLASPWVERLPLSFQRSLQWVMIEKNKEAEYSITHSSEWRWETAQVASDEWLADARVFWLGRAAYTLGYDPFFFEKTHQTTVDMVVRRGHAHNLISNTLLLFGLTGLVLYLFLLATLNWYFWKSFWYWRGRDEEMTGYSLLFLVWMIIYWPLALLGGGPISGGMASLFILGLGRFSMIASDQAQEKRRLEKATTPPRFQLPVPMRPAP